MGGVLAGGEVIASGGVDLFLLQKISTAKICWCWFRYGLRMNYKIVSLI